MFLAIRDIRFAKGRFALLGLVVALITLLVVLVSGLTAGLADQSTSAIDNRPATHYAFGAAGEDPPKESFDESAVSTDQLDTWRSAEGVDWAEALGITQTRVETGSGTTTAAAVFAASPGGELAPPDTGNDRLVITESLAEEEGLSTGDTVTIGDTGLTVAAVDGDDHYSHTPIVWTSLETWQSLSLGEPTEKPAGTVIAASAAQADTEAIDADADTVSATDSASLDAIGAFSSENGTLVMIQGFLYVISALVIGAFLTVWTVQRTGDIAILKALGGSTSYLLRDALSQALVVLLAGTGIGGGVGAGLGLLAEGTVPFVVASTTTVLPVAAMVVLGMLGAAVAVHRITSVDSLTALGGLR